MSRSPCLYVNIPCPSVHKHFYYISHSLFSVEQRATNAPLSSPDHQNRIFVPVGLLIGTGRGDNQIGQDQDYIGRTLQNLKANFLEGVDSVGSGVWTRTTLFYTMQQRSTLLLQHTTVICVLSKWQTSAL